MTHFLPRLIAVAMVCVTVAAGGVGRASAVVPSNFEFTGSGWGHATGLSQYGAKGAAMAGKTYAQILAHYYRSTVLTDAALPAKVRVGLKQLVPSIAVTGDGRFDFRVSGKTVAAGAKGQTWTIKPTGKGAYKLTAPNGRQWVVGDPKKPMQIRWGAYGTLLKINGVRYKRGFIELNTYKSPQSKYVLRSVIHLAPFNTYLYGLAEMPSSWHMEALKAQATAGRTYAVQRTAAAGIRADCNCNVYGDTRDQVYAGYEKEAGEWGARWKYAVDNTGSKVVTYKGNPIKALYSSSSGGHTENNEHVWGGSPLAYLRGVADTWDAQQSPYMNWKVTFTRKALEAKLAARPTTDVGELKSLTLLDPRGVSGRVTPVRSDGTGGVKIVGTKGTKRVSGETLRSVLGLRSTLIKLKTS